MGADPSARYTRAVLPYPKTPIVSVYTPGSAAYMKVTPDEDALKLVVRPRVTTEALLYAGIITHKIADTTTTLGSADATTLASSKTLVDEAVADVNTHVASTTYHVAAGLVIVPGHLAADTTNTTSSANMSNLATGYTLADELDDDVTAHLLDVTSHLAATTAADFGGTPATEPTLTIKVNLLRTAMLAHFADTDVHSVADVENVRLVTATTVGSSEATTQTLINQLKGYWNSHCGVGAANAADLAAVIAHSNALKAGLLEHLADTGAHGGVSDTARIATLTAIADASDQATANTLLTTGIKTLYNAHCAVVDGGAYITAGAAGMPIDWNCLGSFFAKTDAGGVFTVAEFRSQ